MTGTEKVNIVLFSGGRGTATITEAFLKHPQIALTVIVNAYDDGLSTGRLRRYIPQMLGPSDVRKNLSRLIPESDRSQRALKFLLEYRFPDKFGEEAALTCLNGLIRRDSEAVLPELRESFGNLSLTQSQALSALLSEFLRYREEQGKKGIPFDFGDCSLGNLMFAGCFLQQGMDFNRATEVMSRLCEAKGELLNVSLGEPLVLVGVKEDGTYLANEAEIVSKQSSSRLAEIFLLQNYLDPAAAAGLKGKAPAEVIARLRELSVSPKLNPQVREAMARADIIIYGPGTQHSSLFPSYLTLGLTEAIAANADAEKIFIANIHKDHEIQNETAASLTEKLRYYLSDKGRLDYPMEKLATAFFFQGPKEEPARQPGDYLAYSGPQPGMEQKDLFVADWEEGSGVHSGERVMRELIAIVNTRLQKKMKAFHSSVSIIVPCLNEERTVKKVLHELQLLDLGSLSLRKEIIFVDGGSSDQSLALARSLPGVRAYQLERERGRGAALRLGVRKATGNVIVFFPSDAEYSVADLPQVIAGVVKHEFPVVFGSRLIKCVNPSKRILDIYEGNRLNYLISKYGGMLLSVLSLVFYNRFVSDPFTSIKAFDASVLRNLELSASGVDLETEIIAKLGIQGVFILEVPVEYMPRTKREGKKTTVWDGFRALASLFTYRILGGVRRHEDRIDHHSRV
jgi:2-phospho-L-lactate transferase/gluconeogenesis factor (CofD/UPF0052 family)